MRYKIIKEGKEEFINIKELRDDKLYRLKYKGQNLIGFYIRTNNLFCFYSLDSDYCSYGNIIIGNELKFEEAKEIESIMIEV